MVNPAVSSALRSGAPVVTTIHAWLRTKGGASAARVDSIAKTSNAIKHSACNRRNCGEDGIRMTPPTVIQNIGLASGLPDLILILMMDSPAPVAQLGQVLIVVIAGVIDDMFTKRFAVPPRRWLLQLRIRAAVNFRKHLLAGFEKSAKNLIERKRTAFLQQFGID